MTTTKARTARKQHWCHDCHYSRGAYSIAAGHRYLRHVMFPGHELNSGDRPQVLNQCVACANRYDGVSGTAMAGACVSYCCGRAADELPCALPHGHEGDHSCRRCATEKEAVTR